MRQHLDVHKADYAVPMDSLGERVAAERTAKGWSQARLAEEVSRRGFKIGQSGIGNLEKRGDSEPKCIHQLAASLGVAVEWLQTGRGDKIATFRTPDHKSVILERIPLRQADAAIPPLILWKSAPGGRAEIGGWMLSAEKTGEVPRPDFLFFSKRAFALTILNDRNAPAYRTRDTALVDPDSPITAGDDCLFLNSPEAQGGAETVIGCLVRSTDKLWIIRQHASRRESELHRSEFPNAWLIVGRYNRR